MASDRKSGPYSRVVNTHNRAGQAVAVALLAMAVNAGLLFAGGRTLWQDGGVKLCGASADIPMAATSDSAGGAIVVWNDARVWPQGFYAQRVDAAGVPQWSEDGVLLCDSTGQGYLDVIDDGKHGVIAVWSTTYDNGVGLAAQRVRADGTPSWGADGLTLRPFVTYLADMPALVRDGQGGAIIVWIAYTQFGGEQPDTLFACRVDSSGSIVWQTCVRVDTLGDTPPRVCPDDLGGVIIAWTGGNLGPVRVQRVDSAGAIVWGSAGVLACTLSTKQGARACVSVGESRFVVGWFGGAGTWQHRAQMFDLTGNRLWDPAGVPVSGGFSSTSGSAGLPARSTGRSVWVWTENRSGTDRLLAQLLDSIGTRCWDTTGVWLDTSSTSEEQGFSATVDGKGGAIVAWSLYRDSRNSDLYAQHVDSAGHACWSDTGLAINRDSNDWQSAEAAVTDGDGGAIVAWLDYHAGQGSGMYVQRVVDVAGVEEMPNAHVRTTNTGPTVVRGVLRLEVDSRQQTGDRAELLDVSGRKVLELRAGANDVSRLSPGVYFVREQSALGSQHSGLVQKVIIAR